MNTKYCYNRATLKAKWWLVLTLVDKEVGHEEGGFDGSWWVGDVVPGPLEGVLLRVPKGSVDGVVVRWFKEKRWILMKLSLGHCFRRWVTWLVLTFHTWHKFCCFVIVYRENFVKHVQLCGIFKDLKQQSQTISFYKALWRLTWWITAHIYIQNN